MKINNLLRALLLILIGLTAANAAVDALKEQEQIEKVEKVEKEDGRPPIGCRDLGYRFELTALHLLPGSNGNNQSMYLLYNQSNQPLSLFQMRAEDSSRSLFLNHLINPHEWGIFSTGEKLVKFICSIPSKKSPYGQVVDCATSLKICEYNNVRYGLNNRGNFWLYNTATKGAAASAVVHYGIIPGF